MIITCCKAKPGCAGSVDIDDFSQVPFEEDMAASGWRRDPKRTRGPVWVCPSCDEPIVCSGDAETCGCAPCTQRLREADDALQF